VATGLGSYVVNLLNRKFYHKKTIFLLPSHYTSILYVIDSLTIFTAQIVQERYVYTHWQINTYTAHVVLAVDFSQIMTYL